MRTSISRFARSWWHGLLAFAVFAISVPFAAPPDARALSHWQSPQSQSSQSQDQKPNQGSQSPPANQDQTPSAQSGSSVPDKSAAPPADSKPKKENKQEDPPESKLHILVLSAETNKPIGSASVYIRYPEGKTRITHKDKEAEENFKTNQDGSVKVPSVPRGKILIQVIAPGWHTYGKWYDIDKEEVEIEIKLDKPPHWY